jgi:hypothetical protein
VVDADIEGIVAKRLSDVYQRRGRAPASRGHRGQPAWTSVIGATNYAVRFGLSVHLKRTRIVEAMTKLSEAEQKSFEQDALFLQELTAGMPCANRAQSGSEHVHG